jgi:hypothetical protein
MACDMLESFGEKSGRTLEWLGKPYPFTEFGVRQRLYFRERVIQALWISPDT